MQHVLIVDDEPSTRQVLRLYLERSQLEVSTAADLREACDAVVRRAPDLALCDWRLRGRECGIDVIRELRKQVPTLPILVMTGMGSEDVVDEVVAAGLRANDIITKPFRASELVARIRALLD